MATDGDALELPRLEGELFELAGATAVALGHHDEVRFSGSVVDERVLPDAERAVRLHRRLGAEGTESGGDGDLGEPCASASHLRLACADSEDRGGNCATDKQENNHGVP